VILLQACPNSGEFRRPFPHQAPCIGLWVNIAFCHTVFNNIETSRSMVGPGPNPQKVADQMSAACIAFAQSGDPNVKGLLNGIHTISKTMQQ
jgi:hypothetical protein